MLNIQVSVALLFACCLLGRIAVAAEGGQTDSRWDTDFGPMHLVILPGDVQIEGEYPNYQGRLFGTITPEKRIEAVWVQPHAKRRCAGERHGSYYWGTVEWQVVQGEYLQGAWGYCDDAPGAGGAWNGGKPSIGRDFARLFSKLIGVAAQIGGSYVGGGIGGQIAGMAMQQASGQVQSGINQSLYAPPSPSAADTAARQVEPEYPSARHRR